MEPKTKEELEQVLANNRLIAEFMGWEFKQPPKFEYVNEGIMEGWKIHLDWNKLMEVWAKLNEKYTSSYAAAFHNAVDDNEIGRAYNAVVKAITQLNTN